MNYLRETRDQFEWHLAKHLEVLKGKQFQCPIGWTAALLETENVSQ